MLLGQTYEQKRLFGEATAAFARARQVAEAAGEPPPEILAGLIRSHALAGNRVAAMKGLEELKSLMNRRYVSRHDLAIVYLALGEKQQALDWLEKAYEDRNLGMPWLKVDPRFDPLRSEPRFQTLLRRMNFPAAGAGAAVPVPVTVAADRRDRRHLSRRSPDTQRRVLGRDSRQPSAVRSPRTGSGARGDADALRERRRR